jgi:hypothetical protein
VLKFFGMRTKEKEIDSTVNLITKKETLEIGVLDEMRGKFFLRIKAHLSQSNTLTAAEIDARLEHYRDYFENVALHLNDNVSEDVLFALSLKAPIQTVLTDIDTHAPEYIAQLVVEASSRFVILAEA